MTTAFIILRATEVFVLGGLFFTVLNMIGEKLAEKEGEKNGINRKE